MLHLLKNGMIITHSWNYPTHQKFNQSLSNNDVMEITKSLHLHQTSAQKHPCHFGFLVEAVGFRNQELLGPLLLLQNKILHIKYQLSKYYILSGSL